MAKSGVLTVKIVGDDNAFKKTVGGAVKTAGKLAVGIAAGAAAAGAALGTLAKKTADYGDTVAKGARATGLATDSYQELKFAVGQAGVEGEAFDKTMIAFNKRVGEAEQGNTGLQESFARVGVSLRDTNGEMKTQDQLFSESIAGIQELGSEQEKAAVLADLFGARNGPLLMSAVEGGAEGIDELRARAQELGIVMGEDAALASERFNDRLDDLKQGFAGVGRTLGATMIPMIADKLLPAIIDRVIPAFRTFALGVDALGAAFREGDVTSDGFVGVMERIGVVAKRVTDAFSADGFAGAISELGNIMSEVGPKILDALRGIVLNIIEFLTNNIGDIITRVLEFRAQLFDAALNLFMSLVDALPEILPQVIGAITGIVTSVVSTVMETIPQLLDAAVELFMSLVDAAIDLLPTIVDSVLTILKSILTALLDALPRLLDAGLKMFTALLDGIIEVLPDIIEFITGELIPDVLDFLLEALPQLLQTGIELLTALLEGIIKVLPDIIGWIVTSLIPQVVVALVKLAPELISVALEAFGAFLSAAGGFFTDHILPWLQGLPSKIAAAASGMWDGIKDAFRSAVNWIIAKWNDLRLVIGGGTFDLPGPLGSVTVPSITLDTPNIPMLEHGGEVLQTGLAVVHRGERFSGTRGQYPIGGAAINMNITVNGFIGNERQLMDVIRRELIQTARRNGSALGGLA